MGENDLNSNGMSISNEVRKIKKKWNIKRFVLNSGYLNKFYVLATFRKKSMGKSYGKSFRQPYLFLFCQLVT